jgi:Flp pilus assembly protein TadB
MNWRSALAARGLPGRILAVAGGAALLVLGLMFSLLLFAVVAAGALIVWLYLSWKTRGMRRQMREQPPGGRVFEGEVVREAEPGANRIAQRLDD